MVRETLDDQIDIHGGGADLIFPHHENEIAQSESLTRKAPFVQHWTHVGLVTLAGGDKMAHSAENFTTLAAILERYDPQAVRYYLLATHYRASLTFTLESDNGSWRVRGIEDARSALSRLRRALGDEPLEADGPLDDDRVKAFTTAMDADFNTSDALAVLFELARDINTVRTSGAAPEELDTRRRTLVKLLEVLGIDLLAETPRDNHQEVGPYLDLLLEVRRKLREAKQWSLADEIRTRLTGMGVVVEDRPDGESTWSFDRSF
jgi:cysteinyl-tRNA synthetase